MECKEITWRREAVAIGVSHPDGTPIFKSLANSPVKANPAPADAPPAKTTEQEVREAHRDFKEFMARGSK